MKTFLIILYMEITFLLVWFFVFIYPFIGKFNFMEN